jgi:hypothetical protein
MLLAPLRWTIYGAISLFMAVGASVAGAYGGLNIWPGDALGLTFVLTWIIVAAIWNSRWKSKIVKFLFA